MSGTTTPSALQPVQDSPRGRLLHPDPVVRRLAWMTLVNALGNGLFMTVGVLFFTRGLHFSAGQVGFGLTLAGLCGVLASVPAGRAADRWGSKRVFAVLVIAEAAGMAGYGLVRGYGAFVLLACAVAAANRGSNAVRNTLYAHALPKQTRTEGRAYLRAVTNVAMGAGASLAALALQADTRQAYLTAILADSATFVAVAVMLPFIHVSAPPPAGEPCAEAGARPRGALRDLPFVAVTLLNSVSMVQFALIEVGIPLWLVQSTHAPRVLIAPLLLTNTLLVVLFQIRASRAADSVRSAVRAFRRGALFIGAFCLVAALSQGMSPLAASLDLVAAAALQAVGEVLTAAGGWTLSYELAEEESMGAYQGVFMAGQATAQMLGPALVAVTAIRYGLGGWVVLAALFVLCGLAMTPVAGWAQRRRAARA